MDLREIYRRRSRHPGQSYKQRGACDHVCVLHVIGHGSGVSEVRVVEEAFDYRATGE